MGTFTGHILPGSFFVIISIWWTVNIFHHFFKSKFKNSKPFLTQPWYTGPHFRGFPVESVVKLATTIVGMTGELVTAFESGTFKYVGNGQHMTMYFFFGLNGAMDLLKYYKYVLPDGIEAASGILAYGAEAFLFYNHLHGRSMMDVQVHTFLFYTVVMCVFSVFLEVWQRNWVMASLSRAYFTLMQGTWFWQIAFVLYPPIPQMKHWDETNHEQMMIITMIYTWHCAFNLIFMLAIGYGVRFWMLRGKHEDDISYQQLSNGEIHKSALGKVNGINGHLRLIDSDSDEV